MVKTDGEIVVLFAFARRITGPIVEGPLIVFLHLAGLSSYNVYFSTNYTLNKLLYFGREK